MLELEVEQRIKTTPTQGPKLTFWLTGQGGSRLKQSIGQTYFLPAKSCDFMSHT